jgi:hypothetical protein
MADTLPSFFTQSTTLSPEDYANSYVDFYNQTLGTGIKVKTIAEEDEDETQVQPSVLSPVSAAPEDDGSIAPPVSATVLGKGRVTISDPTKSVVYGNVSDINYTSYDDFVKAQKTDMVDSPIGNIKFQEPSKTELAIFGIADIMAPMGGIIGGVLSGEAKPAPFGNDSYRPSGIVGAVWDAAMYFHSKDISAIQAAADPATGNLNAGFMMELNGLKITRAPGRRNYYGNLQDLEQNQVRALEETLKGYIPGSMQESYDEDTGTWKTTGTAGLLPAEVAKKLGGNYTAYGTFVNAYGQGAAYGSQEAAQELANHYNVDYNTATRILSDLRKEAPMFAKGAKAPSDVVNAAIQRFKDAGTQPEEEAPAAAVRAAPQVAPEDVGLPTGDEGPTVAEVASLYEADTEPTSQDYAAAYSGWLAQGGRVGMQQGGVAQMPSGFVDRPPEQVPDGQTVADNVPAELPEGTFVINAAAVEFAGSADIKKMIENAQKEAAKAGAGVDKSAAGDKLIDVAVSRGEVIVAPQIAKIIGYDRLNKINNRGKEEVRRRQQETQQAATGGFISRAEGGDVGEDIPMEETPAPAESVQKFADFGMRKRKRGEIRDFINSLSEREALALLLLTETTAAKDSLESMEAIGEVIKNRAESDYRDFKNVNTIKDVLLQQTRKGAFQFSGLEPTTLYNRLKEVRKGLAAEGLEKTFTAAENTLDTEPDRAAFRRLPAGTLFYTKANAPSQWMRESKDLEYATELGGHEFYRTFQSPEYP